MAKLEATHPRLKQSWWKWYLKREIGYTPPRLIFLLFFSLLGYCYFLGWSADLLSHFRVQYVVLQLIGLVMMLVAKRPQWILVALAGLALNLLELVPYYLPVEKANRPVLGRVKIMQMNVRTGNNQYALAGRAIQIMDPDIISLNEIDDKWMQGLKPFLAKYPYHVENPRDDNFGIAIYSRLPLTHTGIERFGTQWLPSALATVQIKPYAVTILSTHPLPPMNDFQYQSRNEQLFEIARKRVDFAPHLIVLGDLNTTPYSETFKIFRKRTGLADSRMGFGIQPSWPSDSFPLWIPIDHILVSKAFRVERFSTGPDTGSDHRPVMAELSLLKLP